MRILLSLLVFLGMMSSATAQQRWLNRGGGAGNDEVHDMVRDDEGNFYVTGYFSFGGQFGSQSLAAAGSTDVLVAKVNGSTGQFIWAKAFGGAGADAGISITTVQGGGIAVTGFFEGQASFGTQQVSAVAGSQDIFVLRLDNDGNVLWVRTGGGPDSDIPYGIAADNDGNIVTTGSFKGAANFSGQAMTSVIDPILEEPSYDIYILKYGAQGAFQWGLQGAAEYEDRGMAIATGLDGSIFVAGQFSDTITFNQTYNNGMFNAGFLMRLAPDGTEQWLTRFGATMCLPRSMKVDNAGRIYLTGDFLGNMAVFGSQTVTATNPYTRKVFLARFDGDGDADWISTLGSDNQLTSQKVALDPDGAPYIAGDFKCSFSELTDAHAPGVFQSVGFRDVFTAKFSVDGERLREHHMGGPRDDRAGGLALRGVDRPVVAGGFQASFNVPHVASSFLVVDEQNEEFGHVNPATLNYCGDGNYGSFVSVVSAGQRDVFITDGYDASRQPYDYFRRTGDVCDRDYLSPLINNGATTAAGCDSVWIQIGTRTDQASRIGPLHHFNWSNGLNGPEETSFWVTTSQLLTVETTRLDGCRIFHDTIDVTVYPSATAPLVSDNAGFNEATPPNASPIFVCHPDSVMLWGVDMQPNHTYYWTTPSGQVNTDTLTLTETATVHRVALSDGGCSSSNEVVVMIDDFANEEPIDPHLLIYDQNGELFDADTMHVCRLDEILVRAFDSLEVSGDGFIMLYMDYVWQVTPTGLLNLIASSSSQNYRWYSVEQSGWVTISVTVTDHCNEEYPSYQLSRTFYLNMADWSNNPQISGPGDICPGDTVTLTVSGGQTYAWSGPGVVAPNTGSSVSVVTGGDYQLHSIVETEEGCVNQTTVTFNLPIRSAPQITMDPFNGIICPYDSVLMTMPAGSDFQWIGPDGGVIGTTQSVHGQVAGPYYGLMTDPTGCALVSDIVELAEYTSPYIVAEPSLQLCEGQTITLEVFANDGSILNWSSPLTGGGFFQTVSDTGTYTVSATLCGITETVSVTISEFNLPIEAIIVGADSVCHGETVLLAASPAYPFMEWSDGTQSQYLEVTEGGSYSVSIMDDSGCEAVSNVVVPYFRPPLPVPAGLDTTLCHGDTLFLLTQTDSELNLLWSLTSVMPQWMPAPDTLVIGPVTGQTGGAVAFTDSICVSGMTTVNVAPVAASGPPPFDGAVSLCIGDTLQFDVPDAGDAIIAWTLPSGDVVQGASLLVPQPDTGSYTISIDPLVCPVRDSIFPVNIHLPIPLNIQADALHYCITDSLLLSVADVSDAVWHPMLSEGNALYVQEEGLLEFSVTAIDTNGCSVTSDTVAVTGHAPPSAPQVSDTTVCQWQEVVIPFGNSGVSHSWSFLGDSLVTESDTLFIAAIDTGGMVIVTPFDSLCTGLPETFLITVIPFPALGGISDTLTVCHHGPLAVGVAGVEGATVEWTLPDGSPVASDSLLMDIPQEGIHILSAANGACSVTDTFMVAVVAQLPVEVTSEVPLFLCPNATLEVSGPEGFAGYVWLPDSASGMGFTVEDAGQFVLHALDSLGCTHPSDTFTVEAMPAPFPPDLPMDTVVCQGVGLVLSTDSTALMHHWVIDGSPSGNGNVLTLNAIQEEMTVTLSVSDTLTGCMSDTVTVLVGVIALPDVSTQVTTPLCEGELATLSATEHPSVQYVWVGPSGTIGENASVMFGPVTAADAGAYVLTFSVEHCEMETDPVTLEVVIRPDAPSIIGNPIICEGNVLELSIEHPSATDLIWTDPLPGSGHGPQLELEDIQLSQGGQYGAYAENSGCAGDTAYVAVVVSAPPLLDLGVDSTICDDGPLHLLLDDEIFSGAEWSTGETSHDVYLEEPGLYHVTAWTDGGCVLSDTLLLDVIDCDPEEPTIFTPNGDGVNDHFTLYKQGVVAQDVKILNRWGSVVGLLRSVDDSWDGTNYITGTPEPDGTYYYVGEVTLMSGAIAQKKNWLQLLR